VKPGTCIKHSLQCC